LVDEIDDGKCSWLLFVSKRDRRWPVVVGDRGLFSGGAEANRLFAGKTSELLIILVKISSRTSEALFSDFLYTKKKELMQI
jgi:hypothetical protein